MSHSGPMRRSLRCVRRRAQRAWRWPPAWGRSRWRMSLWNKPCSRRSELSSSFCTLIQDETTAHVETYLASFLHFIKCFYSSLCCVVVESRDWGTHKDLRRADCQNGKNRLRDTSCDSATTVPLVLPTVMPRACPQPRSSSYTLCQPCISETAYVQSKIKFLYTTIALLVTRIKEVL